MITTVLLSAWLGSASADPGPDVTYALVTTSILAILVSPAQDHVRRLLHIAKHSWNAAAVSAAQLIVVRGGTQRDGEDARVAGKDPVLQIAEISSHHASEIRAPGSCAQSVEA